MTVSLFGIIAVQTLWISYAIKTEQAAFDKLVYDALKRGVDKVEREEVFYFLNNKINLPEPPKPLFPDPELDSIMQSYSHSGYNDFDFSVRTKLTDSNGFSTIVINGGTTVNERNTEGRSKRIISYDNKIPQAEEDTRVNIIIEESFHNLTNQMDSLQQKLLIQVEKERVVEEKIELFEKNIEQWVMEYQFDDRRMQVLSDDKKISDNIASALINNGINLEFQYQLFQKENDTNIIIKSVPESTQLQPFRYKTELYPNDIFRSDIYISLDFPHIKNHIYNSVALLIIGSLVFTIIILITFGVTIYFIQKQKKISEIKSDFINNMTHEFKTPIASISLASSAMESPKVMGNSERISYYIDIIKKENKRMNNQVEKVLQMAQIDNHDFNLSLQTTDVHEIIENVANILSMRANEKRGRIITSLKAKCREIELDEIHFANVLNNLIDNALKYNSNKPEILLETSIRNNKFILEVSDNGDGMSKEIQKHIFDKFYRKPSGNIHNVKGFGLGLSYVKAIIEAHGGEISVSSEPGHGSKFTIVLNC